MPKTSKVKKKVTKAKSKTTIKTKARVKNKPKTKIVSKPIEITKGPIKISKTYIPKDTEKYMCEKHKVYFRIKLQDWKKELIKANPDIIKGNCFTIPATALPIPLKVFVNISIFSSLPKKSVTNVKEVIMAGPRLFKNVVAKDLN